MISMINARELRKDREYISLASLRRFSHSRRNSGEVVHLCQTPFAINRGNRRFAGCANNRNSATWFWQTITTIH